MGIFSHLFRNQAGSGNARIVSVATPEEVWAARDDLPVEVTVQGSSNESRVSDLTISLVERYNRHTEDYQQTPDSFHETKAAQVNEPFTLQPGEVKTLHFTLELRAIREQTSNVTQENDPKNQSVTSILRTGPTVSNVLHVGNNNKENIRYIVTVSATIDGKAQTALPRNIIVHR